ncbi:hypothetical protein KAI58_01160 [Candidatus Gracilibacteria bacterium]|nr:hypothetical protein [Candidatus Gracilibacteria bacterium]
MMKKLFFVFVFGTFCFSAQVFVDEAAATEGFSLTEALKTSQGVENPVVPAHLPGAGETNKGDVSDLTSVIQNIINGLAGVAGGVAVLFVIMNAAKLVFAVGGSDELTKAKKGFTWAAAGLLLVIFSYVIAKTVISLTYSGESYVGANEDPICGLPPEATESCYKLAPAGSAKGQTRKSGPCPLNSGSVQGPICDSLKMNGKMEEGTSCSLASIQTALSVVSDGLYGLNTEKALNDYINSISCP